MPENACLFLWWFCSSAFHWPYYSHSNSCWFVQHKATTMHTTLLQSCLTLCDFMDCSPPGSSVHGILQARILEWVAMPSSRGSSRPRDRTCVSYVSGIWQAGSLPLVPPYFIKDEGYNRVSQMCNTVILEDNPLQVSFGLFISYLLVIFVFFTCLFCFCFI